MEEWMIYWSIYMGILNSTLTKQYKEKCGSSLSFITFNYIKGIGI